MSPSNEETPPFRRGLPVGLAAMTQMTNPVCPHCGSRMMRWANPQQSTWGGEHQYVCFNDECPYFVRGWELMRNRFNVSASYRYRLEPMTGDTGPLPVWSKEALRAGIVPETETCDG